MNTLNTLNQNLIWSQNSLYCKTLIIRGIGYRAYLLINDTYIGNKFNQTIKEYTNNRYLQIRAGHTLDLCLPLPSNIRIKILKKDRKLVVASSSKQNVTYFVRKLLDYRGPSAYTGRGIRIKGSIPLRKAGKKDKQKGKSF